MEEMRTIEPSFVTRKYFESYRDSVVIAMRQFVEINGKLIDENKQLRAELEKAKNGDSTRIAEASSGDS